jgi:hypothetical protein
MSTPCEQKDRIDELHSKLDILTKLQIRQAEIDSKVDYVKGTVEHVRIKIDNGLSGDIKATHNMLLELQPVIKHHADIVKRVEDIGWFWSKYSGIGLITILLGIVFWAIRNGYLPKT